MTPLFTKLNLKAQTTIHVLDAPASFEPELALLTGVNVVRKVTGAVRFGLAFVATRAAVEAAASALLRAAQGDAVLWFAYPKGTSKKYACEFNRDNGWAPLVAAGYETVRQVAIDEDWSALRFRRAENVRAAMKTKRSPSSSSLPSRLGRAIPAFRFRERTGLIL